MYESLQTAAISPHNAAATTTDNYNDDNYLDGIQLATDRPGAALQKPAACALLKTAVDCAQFYAVLQAAVTICFDQGAAAHSDMLRLLLYVRWWGIPSSRHGS